MSQETVSEQNLCDFGQVGMSTDKSAVTCKHSTVKSSSVWKPLMYLLIMFDYNLTNMELFAH